MKKIVYQRIYEALDLILKREGGLEAFMDSAKTISRFDNGSGLPLIIGKEGNKTLTITQGEDGTGLEMKVNLYRGLPIAEAFFYQKTVNNEKTRRYDKFLPQLNYFLAAWLDELKQDGYFDGGNQ